MIKEIKTKIFGSRMAEAKIYTACFGDYDESYECADVRYNERNNRYPGSTDHLSDRMKAKMYKVLNPDNHEIWVDSSVEMVDRVGFCSLFKGDFCVFKHPFHGSVAQELDVCHQRGFISTEGVLRVKELYSSANIDMTETPVYACGIIYRNRIGNEKINNLWWSLISRYSHRDQLTLPYIVNTVKDVDFEFIDLDIFNNPFVKINTHNK